MTSSVQCADKQHSAVLSSNLTILQQSPQKFNLHLFGITADMSITPRHTSEDGISAIFTTFASQIVCLYRVPFFFFSHACHKP